MKTWHLFSVISLLLLVATSAYAEPVVDIYSPSYKTAGSLINVIAPLYKQDAKLATEGHQIIIRGEQPILNQIQELLLQLDHPEKTFVIEINQKMDAAVSSNYSTNSRSPVTQRFTITENTPLILIKKHQSQQLSTRGFAWTHIETAPAEQESIKINIQSGKDYIYIDIDLKTLINGRLTFVSNRVSGQINQWLAISSNGKNDNNNTRTLSTSNRDLEQLSIKVSEPD